jgi:hypothetical protein
VGQTLSSARRRGCGVHRWWPSALDGEPQHECHLPEGGGLRVGKHFVVILRQQYARKAQDRPRQAVEGEPDTQEPRQESRAARAERAKDLWLANCYFAHDSSGFPALRRFCDAESGVVVLTSR